MTQLNLRLPHDLKKMAEKYAKRHGYKNIQELAKESIREKLTEKKPKGEIMEGKDLLKELDPETVQAIFEVPASEWKKNYYKMRESEKRRLKLLTRASFSKGR